jgi:class 3 adenylate cyclase/Tfp pilus assembly protein PilF
MANRCPKCGYENVGGVNVCGQCAAPLVRACPACDFENPGNFKFCGNCGTGLDAAPAHAPSTESRPRAPAPIPAQLAEKITSAGKQIEGERRTVTALFSDISGYTAISEKLDPEQVYDIIDSTLKAFSDEIYKHEGTIDKVLGDGMMALFGAPIAHEDDPARAVRAALGMQDALRRVNVDLEERFGITLKVRIGLNSGLVAVGSIGSDLRMEYTALGDTVNVASRLQSVAEPGTVLVSRSVYEQALAWFEFRELGSIRVKNRVEPVEIYEVVAPRQKVGRVRGIPGLAAPMVGRAQELTQLRRIADDLITKQRGRIVLVTGNAGIGKSRLTAELKNYLANQWATVIEGACLSYGQPAYGVFLGLLKALFEIADGDPEEQVREKIERAASALLSASSLNEVLPYVEHLFSLRIFEKEMAARIRHLTPPQLQQQTFLAIRDLLVAKAQDKPLVLILEDIHWIDQLSLDLLTFILSTVEDAPLLIYCNSRLGEGQGAEQVQRLGDELYAANFVQVPLSPLSHADSVALIDLLLTISDLPERLKQIIPQRAEGNPFYLEEIIRMLIDRGIIRRSDDHWQVDADADLSGLEVPRTLQGLIMTRVDHLSEGARHALQCAAVIGRDFSYRLLNAVVDGAVDLGEDARELEERELIHRVAGGAEMEFRFHHLLIQETVYNSLLVRRRERLHHKIAEGIETLFRDRSEEHVEQLAFHYAESKDIDRALPYLIRAGEHAADRFANDAALRYYRQAVDCLLKTSAPVEQRIRLYNGLGSVQGFVADYDGAINSFRTALELARTATQVEPPRSIAEIMRRIGRVYERRSDYAAALRWLDDSLAELERDPSAARSEERAHILNDIGWVHYRLGQFDEAYQWRMRSLQMVEGTDHYNEMASAYAGLVALFTRKGDWERALAYGEKGLQLREMIGDTFGVSQSHTSLGAIAGEQCDWDRALHHFDQALEIKQRIGDVGGISRLNSNLGFLYLEKGDYARAALCCQKALEIGERIKNGNLICQSLINLANVRILRNEFAEAISLLNRGLEIATRTDSQEMVAETEWLLAEARLGQKQFDQANQLARQAADRASEIGSRLIEGKARRTLAKIARERHDLSAAEDAVHRALTIMNDLKNPAEIAKSQFQLALLQRERGQLPDARATLEQATHTFERLGAQQEYRQARAECERLTEPAPAVESAR